VILADRTNRGNISEFGAVLVLVVPLVLILIFAGYEFAYGFLIKSNIDNAAKNASRALAIEYGQDPTVATNSTKQQAIFDKIRIPNFVNDNQQFAVVKFEPVADPESVSVTVKYLGGQYNLPKFPNPDPLQIGANFVIEGTSTYRVERQ